MEESNQGKTKKSLSHFGAGINLAHFLHTYKETSLSQWEQKKTGTHTKKMGTRDKKINGDTPFFSVGQ